VTAKPDPDRPGSSDVTQMLRAAAQGDDAAASHLFPLVYDELRALAGGYFRRERSDHTLQPTAVVHEAYLRLIGADDASFGSRAHFFAVAATAMRRILVNHAKTRGREKRGGGRGRVEFNDNLSGPVSSASDLDLVALDQALTRLAQLDAQKARVVEMRFFGGMTIDETARFLGISDRTVRRDWTFAKAWLRGELQRDGAAP